MNARPTGAPSEQDTRRGSLRFLILGTPRSGTTLVQRLASELPGVSLPPETHFFRFLHPSRLRRLRFPLAEPGLGQLIADYVGLDSARGLGVNVDRIVADLGGVANSPLELFDALVRQVAGPAQVYGEKSPPHLLWWRALARARPDLKLVAVVRDPRAVVASNLAVPWGMGSAVVLAEQWAADQREVARAAEELGERCLVLRYEEVVADPGAARARIAALLGVRPDVAPSLRPGTRVYLDWEHGWKGHAVGEVTTDRVDAWREALGPETLAVITAVCAAGMRAFGYPVPELEGRLRVPLTDRIRRAHFRLARRRRRRRIDRLDPVALSGRHG